MAPSQSHGVRSVCGRRREMEDAVSVHLDFLHSFSSSPRAAQQHDFFGIFDGHGCDHVAVACKDRMHEVVAEAAAAAAVPSWKEVMEKSFARMDAEVDGWESRPSPVLCRCGEQRVIRCDQAGSTAVVAVVSGEKIVVGNCGDSRAVLRRGGRVIPLSADHKPDRPDELRRIRAAGGCVLHWAGARVCGVLAMSRAIGDGYLKPYVIAEPEVTETERTGEEECLILGSDGLWDVVTNDTACDVASSCFECGDSEMPARACSEAAALLMNIALARHTADNVSVVVVDLRN